MAVLLSSSGCSSSDRPSPESTYVTMQAATRDGDWLRVCELLTPEARDAMANQLTKAGVGLKLMGSEEVDAIFEKHGIALAESSSSESLQNRNNLADGVTDKNQLIADLSALMQEFEPETNTEHQKLRDIRISGDTATGTATGTLLGEEVEFPWTFQWMDGEWKVASTI